MTASLMDCESKKEVAKRFWVWNDGRVERFKIIHEFNKLVLKDVEEKLFQKKNFLKACCREEIE